jgi:hypothetical protein
MHQRIHGVHRERDPDPTQTKPKNIFTARMTIPSPRSLRHHARDWGKKRQTPEREGQQPRTGTYRMLVEGRDWRSGSAT